MLHQRLDHTPTPDVDVMLSVLCDARIPGLPSSSVASAAAVQVLHRFGVPASVATVQLVALNKAAIEHLPADPRLTAGEALDNPSPDHPWIGGSSEWPHTVVNANGVLLILALDEYRRESSGFDPQPGFFDVPASFWDGSDAVFLAGDDGSGLFVWATPTISCPIPPDDAVAAEVDRLTGMVDAAGHPGWQLAALESSLRS